MPALLLVGVTDPFQAIRLLAPLLFVTILSDYFSLPFVRRFLQVARTFPITASAASSIIGLVITTISFLIFIVATVVSSYLVNFYLYPPDSPIDRYLLANIPMGDFLAAMVDVIISALSLDFFIPAMRPAFVIHLWLPLFALSSLPRQTALPNFSRSRMGAVVPQAR